MKYGFEWTPGIVPWGMLLILPLAPPCALIAVAIVAVAALAAVVALAGVVLASPYLLIRSLRRHFMEPRPSPESSVAIVGVHMAALADGNELS
jgi:hypothetical protein